MTTTEFRNLLQKNLDEIIWRNKGWGPIPIHGKGGKGFTAQDRVRYNQKQIESGKLSKEETAKKQAINTKLSKSLEKLDIKNAYKMTQRQYRTIGDEEGYLSEYSGRYGHDKNLKQDAVNRLRQVNKELLKGDDYVKTKVAIWEIYNWNGLSDKKHENIVKQAFTANKFIPVKVLAEYPDLKELAKKK